MSFRQRTLSTGSVVVFVLRPEATPNPGRGDQNATKTHKEQPPHRGNPEGRPGAKPGNPNGRSRGEANPGKGAQATPTHKGGKGAQATPTQGAKAERNKTETGKNPYTSRIGCGSVPKQTIPPKCPECSRPPSTEGRQNEFLGMGCCLHCISDHTPQSTREKWRCEF